jgi:hypothetical protein
MPTSKSQIYATHVKKSVWWKAESFLALQTHSHEVWQCRGSNLPSIPETTVRPLEWWRYPLETFGDLRLTDLRGGPGRRWLRDFFFSAWPAHSISPIAALGFVGKPKRIQAVATTGLRQLCCTKDRRSHVIPR